MIGLADVRDWLKGFDAAENYYIGRLDNKKEKSLGVYNRRRYGTPVIAIGGEENSSYDVKAVTILLHWNKNARETENAAVTLWKKLQNITSGTVGEHPIRYIRLQVPEPVAVGTDEGGIYEYVIDFDLYYGR